MKRITEREAADGTLERMFASHKCPKCGSGMKVDVKGTGWEGIAFWECECGYSEKVKW